MPRHWPCVHLHTDSSWAQLVAQFAMDMGLDIDDLSTKTSREMYAEW